MEGTSTATTTFTTTITTTTTSTIATTITAETQVFNTLHMQSQTNFWEASLSRLIKVRQTWNRFGLVPVQQGGRKLYLLR